MLAKHMFKMGAVLAIFSVVCTALLAITYDVTRERVEANQREGFMHSVAAVLPTDIYDNKNLYDDVITVHDKALLGTRDPIKVYRARKDGQPAAVILTPVAPDGYSGKINLLVAIRHDGTILGVRVTAHKETPGLGDPIEIERSPWITRFNGHSLTDPNENGWHVKKDGGIFDQFTGATITPRAVVKAVYNSLEYYSLHRDELFASAIEAAASKKRITP